MYGGKLHASSKYNFSKNFKNKNRDRELNSPYLPLCNRYVYTCMCLCVWVWVCVCGISNTSQIICYILLAGLQCWWLSSEGCSLPSWKSTPSNQVLRQLWTSKIILLQEQLNILSSVGGSSGERGTIMQLFDALSLLSQ